MSQITAVAVPKWGLEMTEGTLVAWMKSIGDEIAVGDEVFEMESDQSDQHLAGSRARNPAPNDDGARRDPPGRRADRGDCGSRCRRRRHRRVHRRARLLGTCCPRPRAGRGSAGSGSSSDLGTSRCSCRCAGRTCRDRNLGPRVSALRCRRQGCVRLKPSASPSRRARRQPDPRHRHRPAGPSLGRRRTQRNRRGRWPSRGPGRRSRRPRPPPLHRG